MRNSDARVSEDEKKGDVREQAKNAHVNCICRLFHPATSSNSNRAQECGSGFNVEQRERVVVSETLNGAEGTRGKGGGAGERIVDARISRCLTRIAVPIVCHRLHVCESKPRTPSNTRC